MNINKNNKTHLSEKPENASPKGITWNITSKNGTSIEVATSGMASVKKSIAASTKIPITIHILIVSGAFCAVSAANAIDGMIVMIKENNKANIKRSFFI
jgi:uncharacterized ion transporter superfamily protein YfcC